MVSKMSLQPNIKRVKMKEAAVVTMGQSPPGDTYNNFGLGTPLLNGPTEFGLSHPTTSVWTTAPTKTCKKGDLLFCVRGSTTGRMNWADKEYCIGRGICAIRARGGIDDTFYIYYSIVSELDRLLSLCAGSVFPNISTENLESFDIWWPDSVDRTIIAEILKTLDDKILLNNKINDNLQEIGKLLFRSWFVDFEFPNQEGKPYKSSGGEMVYNPELTKEIPRGWRVDSIGNMAKITRGASPRPIQNFLRSEGMSWVKISDATSSTSKFIMKTKEYIKLEGVSKSNTVVPKTLILSNSATPGLPMIVAITACVHDGWLIFNDYKTITKEFLYYYLLKEREVILSLSNGSVFRNLKTDILKNYRIIIPQPEIMQYVTKLFFSIDNKILLNMKEIMTLETIRDTLLPKLMSGKIRVQIDNKMEIH
jgi:type I restriction enzyme S subunit